MAADQERDVDSPPQYGRLLYLSFRLFRLVSLVRAHSIKRTGETL